MASVTVVFLGRGRLGRLLGESRVLASLVENGIGLLLIHHLSFVVYNSHLLRYGGIINEEEERVKTCRVMGLN